MDSQTGCCVAERRSPAVSSPVIRIRRRAHRIQNLPSQGAAEAGQDMPGPRILPGAAAMDLSAAGLGNTESLPAILSSPSRFTDRMPINVLFVPGILADLPLPA